MVDTTLSPYFDDFDESKGFHRLLFRPTRAVQARELTQMQTILQDQISKFGQNIFLEGTVVIPGGLTIDTNYEFVKIQDADISNIDAGSTIIGNNSGMVAELIQKVEIEGDDPATLYVRYVSGGEGSGGRFENGETLTYTNIDTSSGSFTSASSDASGKGTKVNLDRGVYFVKGFFVVAVTQSLILEKYGIPEGNMEVGLISSEEIVTSGDDSSLFSNAAGTNNENAPGADRLKYALALTRKEDVVDSSGSIDVDYFTVARIQDAVIVEALTRTQYNLLGQELARRTFDESGNYTVDPFIARVEESEDEEKLNIILDPGVAYVRGFEINKPVSSTVEASRALTTATSNNSQSAVALGNYVRTLEPTGLPNVGNISAIFLEDDSSLNIGTARIRYVERESSGIYRFYLLNVNMDPGRGFNEVRSLLQSANSFTATLVGDNNLALTTNSARIRDTNNNSLLFSVPQSRVESISDITVRAQRYQTFTTDASGNVTLDSGTSTVTWAEVDGWIVSRDSDGAIETPSFSAAGNQTITLSGLSASSNYTAIGFVDKTALTTRAKTKTLTTVTSRVITPDEDNSFFLGESDIYDLISVVDATTDEDITSRYILDDGQRDNIYDIGSLKFRTGQVAPSGDVEVSFRYFAHGAGDYFNVDSYNSFVGLEEFTYGDIPTYTRADAVELRFSDVFDFRPRINDNRLAFGGVGGVVNEIPQVAETIQADITYFLPRIDILYLSQDGTFDLAEGIPSLNPQLPSVPSNVMPIYQIFYRAGTIDERDLEIKFIENRRYRMRDIGAIERRVANIEEYTTLSLLESSVESLEVLDADGNNRFKSGFFVDPFRDHAFSDNTNVEYSASISPLDREVRPSFSENNSRMIYKSVTSSNDVSSGVRVSDDVLTLSYTETQEIIQPLASSSINVNPYAVIVGIGKLTLSPESDEWRDTVTETVNVTSTNTPVQTVIQTELWDVWEWNWNGRFIDTGIPFGFAAPPMNAFQLNAPATNAINGSIETTTDTRVLNVQLIPFIRSRKVYFRIEGLLPNTRHRPLFDDVDVSVWCREESYVQVATVDGELSVTDSDNLTGHPEGSSDLVANSQGTIEGSFFIPNTGSIRFRAGRREFKVRDFLATNDQSALSSAFASYTAQGTIENVRTTVTTIRTEPALPPHRIDPVAQSFVVDNSSGAFITSVDAFFRTKSSTVPVRAQIRSMENGLPTVNVVPGAEVFVQADDVNVSSVPDATDLDHSTRFTFPSPIYLEPRVEYAVVILAETTDYEVWTAVTTEFVAGSTSRRITKQPSLGSFFKSQNGSTWTPDQSRDLMFGLNRAKFSTTPAIGYFDSAETIDKRLPFNAIEVLTTGSDPVVRVYSSSHGFADNSSVVISGATPFGGIQDNEINAVHVIDSTGDYDSFTIVLTGANASSLGFGGGSSINVSSQSAFDLMFPAINQLNLGSTSSEWSVRTTTGSSPTGSESPFIRNDFIPMLPNSNNEFLFPQLIAAPINETNNLSGARSMQWKVSMETATDYLSPMIDLSRLSASLVRNRIDNQSETEVIGFNVPANFVDETDSSSGSSVAKHLTIPVTLSEDAIGLTVLYAANVPPNSDIDLYYRVLPVGSSESLANIDWTLSDPDETLPRDDNDTVFREYRHTISDNGSDLEPFTNYQYKLVFRSRTTSRVPRVRDFRSIALAT